MSIANEVMLIIDHIMLVIHDILTIFNNISLIFNDIIFVMRDIMLVMGQIMLTMIKYVCVVCNNILSFLNLALAIAIVNVLRKNGFGNIQTLRFMADRAIILRDVMVVLANILIVLVDIWSSPVFAGKVVEGSGVLVW